jgi:hypothetical protein
MTDIAIRVENLSKQYRQCGRISSAQQARYKTLTAMLTAPSLFARPSSTGGDAPR